MSKRVLFFKIQFRVSIVSISKAVLFQIIEFSISMLFKCKYGLIIKNISISSYSVYSNKLRGAFNKFPDVFCTSIWNCRRLLTIHYVIAIYVMIRLTNFDFRVKSTPTAGIGIYPTKAWLSKLVNFKNAIWTWGHFRRTICNKILFYTCKMPQKRMEFFRRLFDHLAWIEHQFLSGIRDSRKAGSLWGMMRGVGGVRKLEHQSWLAKGLQLGLLCWGFKGVQEETPWEKASTLQIGSVAFSAGQYTSPQLHPCHTLFDQDGHQDTSSLSL